MSSSCIISKTGLNEVYILNQDEEIAISSYYLIDDKLNGTLVGEVMDTTSIPCITNDFLTQIDSNLECLETLMNNGSISIIKEKPAYIGKLKILNDLNYPITPLSNVRKATFENIKPYVYKTDVIKGFNIGIIKGTELMQDELPSELQNVSPLWEKGTAIHQKGIPFALDFNSQREYPHIFISGGSGSGKSFAFRVVMEELMRHHLPGIAFDLHNEFVFDTKMNGLETSPEFKGCYDVFTIGRDIGINFNDITTNELITLIAHKEALTDAQKRILEIIHQPNMSMVDFESQLNVMASAFGIMDGYKAKETDLDPAETAAYRDYKKYVTSPDTIRSILSKFLVVKETGIFFKDISSVKLCLKSSKLAIIRGNVEALNMIISYMVNRFYKERRYYVDNNIHNPNDPKFFPPFFIFLDEAHNYAPKDGSSPSKSLLRKLAQESRKYGVYLTLCTQGPGLLDKTLLDQMNTKIFLRTNDVINKDIARNELNLTDVQYNKLANLPSGNGFISSPTLSKTFHIQFRTSYTMQPKAEGVFDEILSFNKNEQNGNQIQTEICNWILGEKRADSLKKTQLLIRLKNKGFDIDINNLSDIMKQMASFGVIEIEKNAMGEIYKLK
jgi:hypothetical protein